MSNADSSSDKVTSENIFRIADELVHQVDLTKKIVLLMIVAVIVAVPITWHMAPLVKGASFRVVGYAAIAVAAIFLAVGVRQWIVLSKWTSKYKTYKEMQKRIDEKLDFDKEGADGEKSNA